MMLPAKFAERVLRDLGDSEGAALCAALDTEPPVSVRLNPAKCGGPENGGAGREEDADKAAGRSDGVQPAVLADADGRVPWCGDGYYLAARPQFTFDSDFHAGAYYVQEAASQFVGHLLQGVEVAGRRILDLCAAPGGKSFAAAFAMENEGSILSCDLHENKLKRIREGAQRLGITCIETAAVDGRAFREEWAGKFDVVICDVPCSGLGIIRKKPDIRYKDAQEFSALPELQRAILENSARYVKRGGLLVYSTCTILPEENEQVTDGFLKAHDEFTYEAFSLPNGVSAPGHLTLWPQRNNTDGFYLSRMRRKTHD